MEKDYNVLTDLELEKINDNEWRIKSYLGVGEYWAIIPSMYEGKRITEIGDECFLNNSLGGVKIEEGITKIGDAAFLSCKNLEEVLLPESLEVIGAHAFGCNNMKRIRIPKNVKTIEACAFSHCYLNEVEFDPECKAVLKEGCLELFGRIPFGEDEDLRFTDIAIPPAVQCEEDAFEGLITECRLFCSPGPIVAFARRHGEYIHMWDYNEFVCEKQKKEREKQQKRDAEAAAEQRKQEDAQKRKIPLSQRDCIVPGDYDKKVTRITIPAHIKVIEEGAIGGFLGCGDLVSITFACNSQLETIEQGAFSYTKISSIDMSGLTKLKTIPANLFEFCRSLEKVILPPNCEEIGESAFENCRSLRSLAVPASCRKVSSRAFLRSGLEKLVIPVACEMDDEERFKKDYNPHVQLIRKDVFPKVGLFGKIKKLFS